MTRNDELSDRADDLLRRLDTAGESLRHTILRNALRQFEGECWARIVLRIGGFDGSYNDDMRDLREWCIERWNEVSHDTPGSSKTRPHKI